MNETQRQARAAMIRPGSQNARLLDVLADGAWHTSRELHERCGYMRTNSRISELRAHGHEILGESVPGKSGTDGYRYRLLSEPPLRPPGENGGALSCGQVHGGGSLNSPASSSVLPRTDARADQGPATDSLSALAVAGGQLNLLEDAA